MTWLQAGQGLLTIFSSVNMLLNNILKFVCPFFGQLLSHVHNIPWHDPFADEKIDVPDAPHPSMEQ